MPNQILEIKAKNGDFIYMMVDHNKQTPLKDFALIDNVIRLQENINTAHEICYDEAVFPMIDIDQEVDVSWLEDMVAYDACNKDIEKYFIATALQQTKFQMNEKGAKVESAFAMGLCGCSAYPPPKKIFSIDAPFYLWIMRPGMKTPIFAAHIDLDAWKAPIE